jgi:hypothetical protein
VTLIGELYPSSELQEFHPRGFYILEYLSHGLHIRPYFRFPL